jgi:hypothetical protein
VARFNEIIGCMYVHTTEIKAHTMIASVTGKCTHYTHVYHTHNTYILILVDSVTSSLTESLSAHHAPMAMWRR